MLKGHILDERYKILGTIGGGGMANVYLATDTILDRDVAIKVLRMEYTNDDEFIQRFDREAQSATSLSHPNIVNIYDVGEEDDISYMVMEYVDGMTLKEYIQLHGPISVEESLDIMQQLSSAISHAHANDIVHRDIKPQNILMDTYGQVKVTDFGIAVALSATALTQTNAVLGSVHYLSPEQARGGMATKKSDIYSMGIVLYELLTGELPFAGQTAVSIALKHLQTQTPSIRDEYPSIPQSVENIVLQATTKDPFHRYDSVQDMEGALDTALDADRMHEEKYIPPAESGEITKAIPIMGDDFLADPDADGDETKRHTSDESTKPYESQQQTPKKKSGKKKWIILGIILFILLASAAAALFIIPGMLQPKNISVPDVTGMEYEEAVDELEANGLEAEKEMMYSEDVEEDLVVKTSPEADRTVKEGKTVTVYVSQGKEKVAFSDYVGEKFDQVERLLKEKNYEDIISIEHFSDKPEGEITDQIQPVADTEVIPGETRVIFEVSKGPELVKLNNLKGMTEEEAKSYLDENNLQMKSKQEPSDNVPEGEVIRQEPDTNTEMEKGGTVEVFISSGPEEIPPVSHTVLFTVPYKPSDVDSDNDENEGNNKNGDDNNQENEDKEEQSVRIYIDDMNNSAEDIYREDMITSDKEYKITLTIEAGEDATYKVVRDEETIMQETIPYEEGE